MPASIGAGLLSRRNLRDRAHLDAALAALARGRDLCGPGYRLVEIRAVEDVVPGELFFCLGERAVEDERPGKGGGTASLTLPRMIWRS